MRGLQVSDRAGGHHLSKSEQIAFRMAKNLSVHSKNRIPSRTVLEMVRQHICISMHMYLRGETYVGKIFPGDGVSPSTLLAVMY